MNDMTPGKAVEVGSDGNVYFALMNFVNRFMMNFLGTIGVKTHQGVITEVSDKWIKVRVHGGGATLPRTNTNIIMKYDISRVVIVTEAPADSH